MYTFDSQWQIGCDFQAKDYPIEVIKNEPMLFNCSTQAAWDLGGPITRDFLIGLQADGKAPMNRLVVDSRVHMLMPGWFPCIPGYHHDDVPRSRSDGQPDYDNPAYRSKHAMGLVNGHLCPTEFALGTAEFDRVPDGEILYKHWHNDVERLLAEGKLVKESAPTNRIVYFDDRTWHQGTRAVGNGWRWFIRVSWDTDRVPTNELRRQVQVYLENPMEGW